MDAVEFLNLAYSTLNKIPFNQNIKMRKYSLIKYKNPIYKTNSHTECPLRKQYSISRLMSIEKTQAKNILFTQKF